jgi:hypothetical protein
MTALPACCPAIQCGILGANLSVFSLFSLDYKKITKKNEKKQN